MPLRPMAGALALAAVLAGLGARRPGRVAGPGAPSDTLRLESAALRLGFSAADGRLLELVDRASGTEMLARGGEDTGIWALDRYAGGAPVTPAQAGRFTWTRLRGGHALRLRWSDFAAQGARGLAVSVTVALPAGAATSAWRIALEHPGALAVERVRFPRIAPIRRLGPAEALAVPRWMGAVARNPRALLAGGRRVEWPYPGTMSLQAVAFYRDGPRGGPGFYAAANDTLAYRKDFAFWGEDAAGAGAAGEARHTASSAARGAAAPGPGARYLGYEMGTLVPDPQKPRSAWALPFDAVIGTFDGDWITAAERYRAWGARQRWARNARLTNGKVPAWLTNTGMWVWNRGRSPGVVPPALELHRALGLPVSIYWHWWHHGPYDTSFPDYLPPREGVDSFRAAVATAHAAGIHVMAYMNQRLWCTGTPSWTATGAARWAVKEKDGRVREEVYNVFDPQKCATMDVTTAFWRAKYAGMADTVVNRYGVDGIYMDQAVQSLVCWDPSHGHPLGGGHYWMDGFLALEREVRRRTAAPAARAAPSDPGMAGASPASGTSTVAHGPTVLAGEGAGESWLPALDLMLTLQVSQERYTDPGSGWDPIPFWQAVYHRFGLTYGNYSSLHMPPYDDLWPAKYAPEHPLALLDTAFRRQFFLEQARAFVWGLQPTIANFETADLEQRPAETAYMMRLARLRSGLTEFFIHGTFLRAPELHVPVVDVPLSRVSIYAAQRSGPKRSEARFPAALAGAWRAPDGRVAIAVVSIGDAPVVATFTLDPHAYGLAAAGRILRIDEASRRPIGRFGASPVPISLRLPAGGAAVVELQPQLAR